MRLFLFEAYMKVGDKIILKNDVIKIQRPVFIKRINKDTVVFDYGPESVFDIKYSTKTGLPVEAIRAWSDFFINNEDLTKLQASDKTSTEPVT